MSQHLIAAYLNDLSRLRRVSGSGSETVLREAFKDLLKGWGRAKDLTFIAEYPFRAPDGAARRADGALVTPLRLPFGYWEAKDEADDLEAEIAAKFARGYPQDNILFEDSREAVLYQDRHRVGRCAVDDPEALARLLEAFFAYERAEISEFRKAVAQFKLDLPTVLDALRGMIERAAAERPVFRDAEAKFLVHARNTINGLVTPADVREMLIQHILTEELFSKVFGEDDFHRHNNVARELYALEATFFRGEVKRGLLRSLEPYYAAIRSAAAHIEGHSEKQAFLKALYEDFYKVYNPKAADRLGVVYTPGEIVRFMIDGADWLCRRHFGKGLVDAGVEILDPATGTGTFVTELLETFRGQPEKLRHKYREELHANEVAILPYYVANLNIEATYAAIVGAYEEFPNLCFVDTLDNVAGLGKHAGFQGDLLGALSEENVARVRRQNERRISVVIGNPPYNAWQEDFSAKNANRAYRRIDERVKNTYVKLGKAQNKIAVYDMYTRFLRWASDRLRDSGIVAFVTNRNFVEKAAFDGLRRSLVDEFAEVWVLDLGGDVRANPKLSGTKHNVFGIQTGVAITFLVRDPHAKGPGMVRYARRPEFEEAADKLAYLGATRASAVLFAELRPDARGDWLAPARGGGDGVRRPSAARRQGHQGRGEPRPRTGRVPAVLARCHDPA